MALIHRLSWIRRKKSLCADKKKQTADCPDLISVLPDAGKPSTEKMAMPIRTVRAAVSEMPRPRPSVTSRRKTFDDYWLCLKTSDFCFYTRYFSRKIILWIGIILLVALGLEALFWLWILQMTPHQFQQFTSCLDAGVVPSLKERFLYHMACFWGNL